MSPEGSKAAIRRFVKAVNERDFAVIDEIYDAGYVYHGTGQGKNLDLDGLKRLVVRMSTEVLSDARITIDDMIAEEDEVAWRLTLVGTSKETGTRQRTRLMGMSRFADGKIVEEWENASDL